MKPNFLYILLGVAVVTEASRPPWYKPCWIYLCGVELTNPVCAWDPHHGARLFRNDCELDRHNFCYNRHYAIVDNDNNVLEDMKLCNRLKVIVGTAEGGKPSVVEDGNVRVHFMEDPFGQARKYRLKEERMEDPLGQPRKYRLQEERVEGPVDQARKYRLQEETMGGPVGQARKYGLQEERVEGPVDQARKYRLQGERGRLLDRDRLPFKHSMINSIYEDSGSSEEKLF